MNFRRELGVFDATTVVIGGIIGAGIFINPYIVAQRLPSPILVIAAWVVGGLIAAAGAFAFAELGALFPQAGGPYAYLRRAYHPMAGFLYGWAQLLLIVGGGIAAVAITFAEYTLRFLGRSGGSAWLAIAAIVLVSAVNYIGVKPGSRLLNAFVVLKVLALIALIAAGALLPAPAVTAAPPTTSGGAMLPLAFGAALIPIMFSYGGWQNANYVAEEIREPRRNLPRALIAGTFLVIVIYVAINAIYLRALGHNGLASTTTPAADTAALAFGAGGDRIIALAIAISTFGFLNLSILAPTRIYFAMARDGVFFDAVARLHPRYRTPALAITLQATWATVLALTGRYGELIDTVVFADWIFFGATVAAIFVFRRRAPVAEREPGTFATPGYPVVPALFVLAAVAIVASVIAANPVRSALGAGLLAAGIPAYLAWSRRAARSKVPATDSSGGE